MIQLRQDLENACIKGDFNKLQEISTQCPDNILNSPGLYSGLSPVINIVERHFSDECCDLLEILFKAGANLPNAIDYRSKEGILHILISRSGPNQHLKGIIKWLMEIGCDPLQMNKNGETPIYLARKKQYFELALMMEDFMKPKSRNKETIDTEERPIKSNVTKENKSNDQTPKKINESSNVKPEDTDQELQKEKPQKKVNKQDKDEFLLSIVHGDIEEIKRFLTNGLDVNMEFEGEYTAIHFSVCKGQNNIMEILKLLKINNANFHSITEEGDTVLNLAVKKIPDESLMKPIVEFLLAEKVDKSIKDKDGNRAVDIARLRRFSEIVEILSDLNHFEGPYHDVHLICKDTSLQTSNKLEKLEKHYFAFKKFNTNIKTVPDPYKGKCLGVILSQALWTVRLI